MLGRTSLFLQAVQELQKDRSPEAFNAQSIKLCVPLTWRQELLEGIISPLEGGPRQALTVEPREVLEPPVFLQAVSGPSVSWIRDHGPTAGCTACDNINADVGLFFVTKVGLFTKILEGVSLWKENGAAQESKITKRRCKDTHRTTLHVVIVRCRGLSISIVVE